jgi:hypothetical protein
MSVTVDIVEQTVSVYDGATKYYGSFYSTQDQTNAGATSVNKMTLNTTDLSNGVTVVSNSRITIANPGVYNIAFSVQLEKTDSGDDAVQIWLQKGGVNVANTATEVTIVGNNGKFVAAWNFFVQAAAGDYYELCWHSADTAVSLQAQGTASNPTRPAIPSVIVTVNQVS